MKSVVFSVTFVILFASFQINVSLAQGDSNLAGRLFGTAPKKTKEVKRATPAPKTSVAAVKKPTKTTAKPNAAQAAKPSPSINQPDSKPEVITVSAQADSLPTVKTSARAVPSSYKITFITQKPNIEIYIDDELAGKTNQKAEFTKDINEGTYNVSAKYTDDDIVEKTVTIEKEQKIYLTKDDVETDEAENTTSTLKISPTEVPNFEQAKPLSPTANPRVIVTEAKKLPTPEPKRETVTIPVKAVAVEVPKKAPERVLTVSDKLRIVLDKYYQSQTTETLDENDWQFIRQTLLSGETANLNQTEADMFTELSLAKLDLLRGNFNTAIKTFTRVVDANPKSKYAFMELANAYYRNGNYTAATNYYKVAINLDPIMWQAQLGYAKSLLRAGNRNDALQVLDKINRSDYKSGEINTLTAEILLAEKQYEKVTSLLLEINNTQPNFENSLILAEAFEKTGRVEGAVRTLRIADQLMPNNPRVLIKLGELLIPTNKAEALLLISKAIELDKNGFIDRNDAQKLLRKASK